MQIQRIVYSLLFYLICTSACRVSGPKVLVYQSPHLSIEQRSKNTYIHISYLETDSFGRVACNGMIVINQGEAVVFDTPTEDSVSLELIHWLQAEKKTKIKAVVINHFHADCLGGLDAFHQNNIPSYANQLTIDLAQKDPDKIVPLHALELNPIFQVGKININNHYFGAGHTIDNIVSYVPSDKVLFGGCLIKAIGAGKGNLADADINEWANTVTKIRTQYSNLKIVIPGHGHSGGIELLDYTIEMFHHKLGQDL